MTKRFSLLLFLTALLQLGVPFSSYAYVIDGSVSDWGINLSAATNKGYLDTHLPSGGIDIEYRTEDNADASSGWVRVGPGWSLGNSFDAEAMYFDNDIENAYIAIVTGLTKEGVNPPGNAVNGNINYVFKPGDIFIDVDGVNGYEYGIDIDNSHLYSVNGWKNAVYSWADNPNPWIIKSWSSDKGIVPFIYSGNQNNHYVLEAQIPLNLLGLSANHGDPVKQLKIHWTMACGNDYLNLTADVNPVTPEPASLTLFGLGLLGLAVRRKKKSV